MEQDSNLWGTMLGIFAKIPRGQAVKTRLQVRLTRVDAERLYRACLVDTIETCLRIVERPVLFIDDVETPSAVVRNELVAAGLQTESFASLQVEFQNGRDLGERMENAFTLLCGSGSEVRAAMLVGSDSPALPASEIERGFARLRAGVDLVLGPATDGGYWVIGMRDSNPGLLREVSWSSSTTLAETEIRARARHLRVEHLQSWTDVDRPEDLAVLAVQIKALRTAGDLVTARHSETVLRSLGFLDQRD